METKACTKCKVEKSLDKFLSDKRHLDGKESQCKECHYLANRKWQDNHKTEIKKQRIIYRLKNKEKIAIRSKKYDLSHRKEFNERDNKRRKTDINYKIKYNLRRRILLALKGNSKFLSTMLLIGCEIDYLIYYLQSQFTDGMSWDNHGDWHIDHKRPCKLFDLSKPEQQQKCFNYKNLQPLWAKDNLSKGVNY